MRSKQFIVLTGGSFGGLANKKASVFDLKLKRWSHLPDFNQARFDHGSLSLEDNLFIIGGRSNNNTMIDSIEYIKFGTVTSWSIFAQNDNLLKREIPAVSAISATKFAVYGGNDLNDGKSLQSGFIVDIVKQSFKKVLGNQADFGI